MDEDPLVGEVLASRYRVEERLGKGATGVVYRARHVKVGRPFAVKVLHVEHETDATLVRRFEREAELGGMVRHPNVISVVDVGETHEGERYMVMELAIGTDLATLIARDAPMPAARVIHLIRQILEGLYHAHQRGVIHRDLKPENIIVEAGGASDGEVPRIVDFGIAIARDEALTPESPERLTTNGLVLGTPHYMAPEQATGVSMDHRIDLFALGVIMYEMLTGAMPFDGDGVEVARANLLEVTPVFGVRVPDLQADALLEAFTLRLMHKKPEERFVDANGARDLLDLIDRDRVAAGKKLGVAIAPVPQTMPPAKRAATVPERPPLATPPPSSAMDTTRPIAVRAPTPPAGTPAKIPTPPAGVPAASESSTLLGAAPTPMRTPSAPAAPIVPGTLLGVGAVPVSDAPPPRLARSSESPPQLDRVRNDTPVEPPASSPVPRIAIAAVAALLVMIGIWALVHGGGSAEEPVAKTEPKPVATPPPAPVDHPVVVDPPAPTPAPDPVPDPTQGSDAPASPPKPPPKPTPHPTAPPTTPKPPVHVDPPPPATNKPDTSAHAILGLYQAVGKELKKLADAKGDDAVADLWPRYRLIRIQSAVASEDSRAKTYDDLTRLYRDIAARGK